MFKLLKSIKSEGKKEYEFGIKKQIKFNGTELLVPIFREKGFFSWKSWSQIIKINDKYNVVDFIDDDSTLTETQCLEYIKSYKAILDSKYDNLIERTELLALDDNKINNINPVKESIFKKIRLYLSSKLFLY